MQACRFGHAGAASALIHAAEVRGCLPRVVDMLDGAGFAAVHNAAQWGHAEVTPPPRTTWCSSTPTFTLHERQIDD